MMNRRKSATSVLMMLLAFGLSANAQEQHNDYVYVMGSYVEPDIFDNVHQGTGVQLGAGWALNNLWNIETFFQRTRSGSEVGVPRHTNSMLGLDLQMLLNREGGFTPYLFIGGGYQKLDSSTRGDDPGAAWNGGAGFRANIFGSSRVSLRGEWRYRQSKGFGATLDDNLYNIGVEIPFGDPPPPPVVDADGDGVVDGMDRCPNTPAGTPVDARGCERDSDGDGVRDSVDRCPNTPAGTAVDSSGCPADRDGDGVADGMDECPNTVAGARVDAKGCELDSDGDGVVDRLDRCENTPSGVQIDVYGCEIKDEIQLPGVNFESNSDQLLPGAEAVLNGAAQTLQNNPEIEVEVAGHTDSDGAADYNESLSARRAATVRDYLMRRGVDGSRMTTRGYGETQPIADNSSATGKAANRRVVLRITER